MVRSKQGRSLPQEDLNFRVKQAGSNGKEHAVYDPKSAKNGGSTSFKDKAAASSGGFGRSSKDSAGANDSVVKTVVAPPPFSTSDTHWGARSARPLLQKAKPVSNANSAGTAPKTTPSASTTSRASAAQAPGAPLSNGGGPREQVVLGNGGSMAMKMEMPAPPPLRKRMPQMRTAEAEYYEFVKQFPEMVEQQEEFVVGEDSDLLLPNGNPNSDQATTEWGRMAQDDELESQPSVAGDRLLPPDEEPDRLLLPRGPEGGQQSNYSEGGTDTEEYEEEEDYYQPGELTFLPREQQTPETAAPSPEHHHQNGYGTTGNAAANGTGTTGGNITRPRNPGSAEGGGGAAITMKNKASASHQLSEKMVDLINSNSMMLATVGGTLDKSDQTPVSLATPDDVEQQGGGKGKQAMVRPPAVNKQMAGLLDDIMQSSAPPPIATTSTAPAGAAPGSPKNHAAAEDLPSPAAAPPAPAIVTAYGKARAAEAAAKATEWKPSLRLRKAR